MIEFTKIERDSVEILMKNIRYLNANEESDVLTYQIHKIDVELFLKALEKSLE